MWGLWVLAFLVNLFLLGAVFDIHFKSPIVTVHTTHRAHHPARVSRVVFFVADGLRADTFYDNPPLRPYLTNVMNRGDGVAWGISDTRVPTESRPGHVALFSGFYEDPSAVFTGWKNNMVEFDSVFNQSKGAVALGSPDVINMFAQGAAKEKVYAEAYSSDWQDFLEANSSILDTWVFERFTKLAQEQKLPRHDQLILFLHLLGIDNTGHATKPHSLEYKRGLSIVDNIVDRAVKTINEYYGDDKTLFVFTSDHGMTDWGSHGSGSPHETETPIVVWGPGIRKTENLRIKQGDIASLVAGSLGSPFPSNSIGKFPSSIWSDESFAYENLKANLLQVLELVKTKKAKIVSERNFGIVEYPGEVHFLRAIKENKGLSQTEAISNLDQTFEDVLQANVYYERYNLMLQITFSVASFLLLMTVVAICILAFGRNHRDLEKASYILDVKLCTFALVISVLLIKGIIGWSLWKISYSFVPVYLLLLLILKLRHKISVRQKAELCWSLGLSTVGVQILVFGFWERSILSIVLVLNLLWALGSQKKTASTFTRWNAAVHFIAVGILALFPTVPTVGKSRSTFFTILGPVVSSILVGICLACLKSNVPLNRNDNAILRAQLYFQSTVAFLCHSPTFIGTRITSWTSLVVAMILPTLVTPTLLLPRLISIFMALGTTYAFLGVSYETLFFPFLFIVLLLFLKLEIDEQQRECSNWMDFFSLQNTDPTPKKSRGSVNIHQAFRRAWFHLSFVLLSFFGTGNIGSLSSFDPTSTRCFVSVFNPWIMMILMLIKILSPFLLVSSFWRALLPSKTDVERNFGILLLLCQGMSLTMFFKVRNEGSWLDIGMSISHFVIVQLTTLFLLIFHFIANYLVAFQLLNAKILPTTMSIATLPHQNSNKHH